LAAGNRNVVSCFHLKAKQVLKPPALLKKQVSETVLLKPQLSNLKLPLPD